MCDISIREYIRWLPDVASEPTSTIVLTTPQRRFVDIRVLKPAASADGAGDAVLSLSRLDWAIAGTSSSAMIPSRNDSSKEIKHSQWAHWIDSRSADCDGVIDEGDMFDDPSDLALTLETGRMLNPATGVDADYEEVWRSEPIQMVPGPGGEAAVTCLALQMEGSGEGVKRGLLVRLGQYCQAFARDGDEIALERLKWDPDQQRWASLVRIGRLEFPTDIATCLAHEARIDDEVKVGSTVWKVIERL
ncbi:hypothetical protein C8A05DRAFT_38852 [Staphylotrichum tortipilum]|uniref:Protein HRI1 n=1 Tax=Staphylotrichum tortipilum TaxID=2831512 RepID=A0AAN6RNW6_9PEZI|nr:hypothetical protein C8A05DRAFT_38852 [Staphylotrichum longicolle]